MIQNLCGGGSGDIDSIIDDDTKWTKVTGTCSNSATQNLYYLLTDKRFYLKGTIIFAGTQLQSVLSNADFRSLLTSNNLSCKLTGGSELSQVCQIEPSSYGENVYINRLYQTNPSSGETFTFNCFADL